MVTAVPCMGTVWDSGQFLPQSLLISKLEVDQINPFSLRTSEIIYHLSISKQDEWHNWSRESIDFRSKIFTMLYFLSADGTWT